MTNIHRSVWTLPAPRSGPCLRDSLFSRGFCPHILIAKESNTFLIACADRVQLAARVALRHRADMAEVHQLIIQHGIEEARRQAVTKHERMVIEAAYQVLQRRRREDGLHLLAVSP